MKYTKTQLNKMSIYELQNILDKQDNVRTVWNGATKRELINNILIRQYNHRKES